MRGIAKIAILWSLATTLSCGGAVDDPATADPLPAEFAFDYISLVGRGGAELAAGDPTVLRAEFTPGQGSTNPGSAIYPIQYGTGYEYPILGQARFEIDNCRDTPDDALFVSECDLRVEELEFVVVPEPAYPDEFMDEAKFTLDAPALGSACQSTEEPVYWLELAASIIAETESGASRSEYAAVLRGGLGAQVELTGHLTK